MKNLLADYNEKRHGDFSLFPIGTYARVDCKMQDFTFFNRTEEGLIIKNENSYLSIILAFTNVIREFEVGYIQHTFNFNPVDLIVLAKPTRIQNER